MDVFLIDKDEEHADGLMQKLSGEKKPGQIVPLSKGEMDLYRSDRFRHVLMDKEKSMAFEVNPDKSYVFVVNEYKTVLDDVIRTIERLGLNASIVRVRD